MHPFIFFPWNSDFSNSLAIKFTIEVIIFQKDMPTYLLKTILIMKHHSYSSRTEMSIFTLCYKRCRWVFPKSHFIQNTLIPNWFQIVQTLHYHFICSHTTSIHLLLKWTHLHGFINNAVGFSQNTVSYALFQFQSDFEVLKHFTNILSEWNSLRTW